MLFIVTFCFFKYMFCIDFFKFCCPISTNFSLILSGISLFIGYIFATNKFKITYLLCMLIHIHEKPDVYILDDLDRSSLKEEDRWALLANLWENNTHYIVPLGYNNNETKLKYYELANKIEAEVIFIENNWKINENILTQYLASIPFEKEGEAAKIEKLPFIYPQWMKLYSAQKLISVLDAVKNKILFQKINSQDINLANKPKIANLTFNNINLLVDLFIIKDYLHFICSDYPRSELKVNTPENVDNQFNSIEFLLNDDTRPKDVLHDYSDSIIKICKKIHDSVINYNEINLPNLTLREKPKKIFDQIFLGTDDEIINIVTKYESYLKPLKKP
jgi:hypothetical protein